MLTPEQVQQYRSQAGLPTNGLGGMTTSTNRQAELNSAWGVSAPQSPDEKSAAEYNPSFPAKTGEGPVDAGMKAAGNIPSSAINFAKNLYEAIRHPVLTGEGVVSAVKGSGEALGREILSHTELADRVKKIDPSIDEQTFDAIVDHLKTRYGSLDNAQRTATNDPFGFGADVMGILAGGGALAKTAGLTKGNLVKDVIPTVTKPVTKAATAVGTGLKQVIGASTGAGSSSVDAALRGTEAFKKAMRGQTTPEDIVHSAEDVVQNIKTGRAAEYQDSLREIGNNTNEFDISPVQQELETQLGKFGVSVDEDGKLDFSRSAIGNNGTARADVQEVYNTVKSWGEREGDKTPLGLDTLKRQLGDTYAPSSQARAFVQAVKSRVSGILANVPGYGDMTSKYQKASDLLDDIRSATSVGGTAKADTIFTKLTTAMRADKDFRLEMLGEMNKVDPELMDKIGGANMSSIIPRGLVGRGADAGAAVNMLMGGFNPHMIPLMLATSPRLVGEFLSAVGYSMSKTKSILSALSKVKSAIGGAPVATFLEQSKSERQ